MWARRDEADDVEENGLGCRIGNGAGPQVKKVRSTREHVVPTTALSSDGDHPKARRYVDAYRDKPETAADERAALVRAFEALAAEPWDAAR